MLTNSAEQFDTESGKYEEEQEEEESKVPDLGQGLHDRVQQCSHRLSHLQEFQHFMYKKEGNRYISRVNNFLVENVIINCLVNFIDRKNFPGCQSK